MKFRFVLVLSALLLAGCASTYRPPSYRMGKVGDLLTSNSSMFTGRDQMKKKGKGEVEVYFKGLIQNTSTEKSYQIQLDKAGLKTNKKMSLVRCETPEQKGGNYELKPGKKVLVNCTAPIKADSENELLKKDTVAVLIIQYGDLAEQLLGFEYLLRIEDFE